jgi:hypothetical protein
VVLLSSHFSNRACMRNFSNAALSVRNSSSVS